MAKEEAEAKLGAKLKDTRKHLQKIERLGEERLREQGREARKAEKTLTVGHKRELAAMREDLERTRAEDVQNQEELVRKSRVKVSKTHNKRVGTDTATLGRNRRDKRWVGEGSQN